MLELGRLRQWMLAAITLLVLVGPALSQPAEVAPAAAEPRTIELPGPATQVVVGGNGRFLIFHIADKPQLAIFDMKLAKLAKIIPTSHDTPLLGAGNDKIYLANLNSRTLVRYSLATFEKEVTTALPVDSGLCAMALGSASNGPLMMARSDTSRGGELLLVDAVTHKRLEGTNNPRPVTHIGPGMKIRATADGRCFALTSGGSSSIATLSGDSWKEIRCERSPLFPAADGRAFYTSGQLVSSSGVPIGTRQMSTTYLPAVTGPFFLTLPTQKAISLNIHIDQDVRPVLTLENFRDAARLKQPEDHLFYHPAEKLLVTLEGAKLNLFTIDLRAELDKAGRDYLLMIPKPVDAAVRGKPFEGTIEVWSRKGGVKVAVDGVPPGFTATNAGKLTWAVPKDFTDTTVNAILTISDASGQEVVQHLRIPVVGEAAKTATPVAGTTVPVDPAAPRTVKLPGAVGRIVVGGGGRFLLIHMPQLRQIAVFDAKDAKVVKYLPVAEDTAHIAAGLDHLFVVLPASQVIQRWSLKTFERETAQPQPITEQITGLCMGSASKGPLLVCPVSAGFGTSGPKFVDAQTLKPIEGKLPEAAPLLMRASADGRLFVWREGTGAEGHRMCIAELINGKPTSKSVDARSSLFLPSPDARHIYSVDGVFTSEHKKLHPLTEEHRYDTPILPAASGNLFFELQPPDKAAERQVDHNTIPVHRGRAKFFLTGQYRSFATMNDIDGIEAESYGYGNVRSTVMLDMRVHLLPDYNLLVTLPGSNDHLVLHNFNFDDLLVKSGMDYLLVSSVPPSEAVRGATFNYTPVVKSKKGSVKITLASGPAEMVLVDGIRIVWAVPGDLAAREVDVILNATDASGQEVFHTFKLKITDAKTKP